MRSRSNVSQVKVHRSRVAFAILSRSNFTAIDVYDLIGGSSELDLMWLTGAFWSTILPRSGGDTVPVPRHEFTHVEVPHSHVA